MFVTTNNMEKADQLCYRVTILNYGRILVQGSPAALKDSLPGGYLFRLRFNAIPRHLVDSLLTLKGVTNVRSVDQCAHIQADRSGAPFSQIVAIASEAGVQLPDLQISEPSLESLLVYYTKRGLRQ